MAASCVGWRWPGSGHSTGRGLLRLAVLLACGGWVSSVAAEDNSTGPTWSAQADEEAVTTLDELLASASSRVKDQSASIPREAEPESVQPKPWAPQDAVTTEPAPKQAKGKPQTACKGGCSAKKPTLGLPGDVNLAEEVAPPSVDPKLGTGVEWIANLNEATEAAAKQHKLLFVMHISGNFARDEFT